MNYITYKLYKKMEINFTTIIHSLIKDVMNNEYKTIGDLNLIIAKLDNLSDFLKEKHENAINTIKMTIRRLHENRFDFHILTQAQIDTLLFTLSEAIKMKSTNKRILICAGDIVISTTDNLINNLTGNILSSSITNLIEDYLEIINLVLAEDQDKYSSFHRDILLTLENSGWVENRGFQREPNKQKLIEGLTNIVYIYTK